MKLVVEKMDFDRIANWNDTRLSDVIYRLKQYVDLETGNLSVALNRGYGNLIDYVDNKATTLKRTISKLETKPR